MRHDPQLELTGIKVVFLDAGDTILHPHPSFRELFESTCAEQGVPVNTSGLHEVAGFLLDELDGRQREGFTFSTSAEVSRAFWLDFYSRLLGGLGAPGDGDLPFLLYQTFSDPLNYVLFDDVTEALGNLQDQGMEIGLISNFEAWLVELLDHLGVLSTFKHRAISGLVGMEKPHRGIFDHALEISGASPDEALHVGDSPASDVAGAMSAGITPVLIDRFGRYPQAECLRITDLRQLPSLLEAGKGPG